MASLASTMSPTQIGLNINIQPSMYSSPIHEARKDMTNCNAVTQNASLPTNSSYNCQSSDRSSLSTEYQLSVMRLNKKRVSNNYENSDFLVARQPVPTLAQQYGPEMGN
jgi:hypothetical protein